MVSTAAASTPSAARIATFRERALSLAVFAMLNAAERSTAGLPCRG